MFDCLIYVSGKIYDMTKTFKIGKDQNHVIVYVIHSLDNADTIVLVYNLKTVLTNP